MDPMGVLITLSETITFLRFCWKMILSFGGSAHVPVIRLSVSTLKSDEQSLPKTLQGSHCTDEAGIWEKAKTETHSQSFSAFCFLNLWDHWIRKSNQAPCDQEKRLIGDLQGPRTPRFRLKHARAETLVALSDWWQCAAAAQEERTESGFCMTCKTRWKYSLPGRTDSPRHELPTFGSCPGMGHHGDMCLVLFPIIQSWYNIEFDVWVQ